MGEKHSMFVRFVHHSRKVLAGQSDLITLDLTEKATVPTDDQLDSETDVFPGLTTIEEKEEVVEIEQKADVKEYVFDEEFGTNEAIRPTDLTIRPLAASEEESVLTFGPATIIVSGIILLFTLAMIVGGSICCYMSRQKRKQKPQGSKVRHRHPSIIIQRVSDRNSGDSPNESGEESNVPRGDNGSDWDTRADIEQNNGKPAVEDNFDDLKELDELCKQKKRAKTF